MSPRGGDGAPCTDGETEAERGAPSPTAGYKPDRCAFRGLTPPPRPFCLADSSQLVTRPGPLTRSQTHKRIRSLEEAGAATVLFMKTPGFPWVSETMRDPKPTVGVEGRSSSPAVGFLRLAPVTRKQGSMAPSWGKFRVLGPDHQLAAV